MERFTGESWLGYQNDTRADGGAVDLEGALVSKPVRFRVEIRTISRIVEGSPLLDAAMHSPALDVPSTPMTPSPSPYSSMLVITQEKGAHSTLKAIYARLRTSWK